MVRKTGSVKEANSLTSPTGELLSSVVRRNSGKSAKRSRGMERSEPTKTEPIPSSAPRKDRLLSTVDPCVSDLSGVVSESPADAHIELSPDRHMKLCRIPRAEPLPGGPE